MPDASTSSSPSSSSNGAPASANTFSNILCAVDGTRRSYAAVEQAAALAGAQGRLTLLAVTAEGGSGTFPAAAIGPDHAERILAHASRIADAAHVPSTQSLEHLGPPAQVILDRAAEHDLLALGAPWASWLGALLLDGVAEATLGELRTATLAARVLPGGGEGFAREILIASDGLDGSDQLVELAAQIAGEREAHATLLHLAGVESQARPHRIEAQGELLRAALGESAKVRVEVGDAHELILSVASEIGCSLVIMSSRRLGGLSALGSVSRRVVHKARCSVLLLPPELLQV